jgi:hypothetical protein
LDEEGTAEKVVSMGKDDVQVVNCSMYGSRKEQMEAFIEEYKEHRGGGLRTLEELVKSACMCGAAEERYRTLEILKGCFARDEPAHKIPERICSESVLKVLGYE